MDGSALAAVMVRTPLLTVQGTTDAVCGYRLLIYHSCSPLPLNVEPLLFVGIYQKLVAQVPETPFHKLRELNSSSKVKTDVPDRLLGLIIPLLPHRLGGDTGEVSANQGSGQHREYSSI